MNEDCLPKQCRLDATEFENFDFWTPENIDTEFRTSLCSLRAFSIFPCKFQVAYIRKNWPNGMTPAASISGHSAERLWSPT